MRQAKTVEFEYARTDGSESFADGVALLLPSGGAHLTMWGGENCTYVTMSGTQNRRTHVVSVHTSCDSLVHVVERQHQGAPYPAPSSEYHDAARAFVESSLREVAAIACSHCNEASKETVYGILAEHLLKDFG